MEFKFDDKAMKKVLSEAVAEERKNLQRDFDRLGRTYKGRPVDEVQDALRREFRKSGGSITDPELTEWATAISEGTRIVIK